MPEPDFHDSEVYRWATLGGATNGLEYIDVLLLGFNYSKYETIQEVRELPLEAWSAPPFIQYDEFELSVKNIQRRAGEWISRQSDRT